MENVNLNTVINLRGANEDFNTYFNYFKKRKKTCRRVGSEFISPIFNNVKNIDIQHELRYMNIVGGEGELSSIFENVNYIF